METQVRVIAGKNFGDEGKGLAVNHFCRQVPDTLVVKHNGGAQAGHTVETDGKRFVFHQLSAGSFCGADTFWADSYYPDLYKLSEEIDEFNEVADMRPVILCDPDTNVTLIDDVLLNMIAETLRGRDRHGSCGMGINECDIRTKAGYGVRVEDFLSKDTSWLINRVMEIRDNYSRNRLTNIMSEMEIADIDMNPVAAEYHELLCNDDIIRNAVTIMQRNASDLVKICDNTGKLLKSREQLIFENGQGLLLDSENAEYAPNVTASRTGLYQPCRILSKYHMNLTEAVYVSRTYVTRHGAGCLPYECKKEELGIAENDATNVHNEWQGSIRYARHGETVDFTKYVRKDIAENSIKPEKTSLFMTHLNETEGKIRTADRSLGDAGDIGISDFLKIEPVNATFDSYYLSDAPDRAWKM